MTTRNSDQAVGGVRRIRSRWLGVGLVAVSALLAAGCATGTDSSASPSPSTSSAASFRIGLEAPLTGAQSELGQGMLQGAQLAAAQLNAKGGIRNQTVEIVAIDDAADPATGIAAANDVVADLDAVVGPYNSGVGLATLPIYIQAGLVPMRLTSADNTAGLGFTLQPMTSQIAPTAGAAISDWLKAGSVAIINDSSADYTNQAATALREDLAGRGVTVSAFVPIAPGQSSYAEALAQANATAPAVTYLATYFPEAAVMAKELAAANSSSTCVADYSAFDNGFIANAGVAAAQRCDVLGVPAPSDFSGASARVAEFQQEFSSAPNVWSPYTYDSVLLLADAVTRANSTDPQQLSAALADTKGWTGWTGGVAFESPSGNRVPSQVAVLNVNADGQFTVNTDWVQATGFTY